MPISRPTTKTIISTTGWGIPITDEVNRLTPQSDSNVTRIAALETATAKTAWTNMSLSGGWIAYDAARTPQYRKVGDIVHLRGLIKNGPTNSTIWNIPVGFRAPTGRSCSFALATELGVSNNISMDATVHVLQFSGAIVAYIYLDQIYWSTI